MRERAVDQLAALASCYENGSHALTAGRPGSWEAGHIARLLAGTAGEDDEMLDHYATAPGGPATAARPRGTVIVTTRQAAAARPCGRGLRSG